MQAPVKIHDTWFEPYLDNEQIEARIQLIADAINRDYEALNPLFVGVLKGAVFFCTALVQRINHGCELDFVKVSSYQQMSSTGEVKTILGLSQSLYNRHVILVEDIVDTGITLNQLIQELKYHQPASLQVAALTTKPEALQEPAEVAYLGFELPNEFVVGFGLDYEQQGRNLNGIYKRKS